MSESETAGAGTREKIEVTVREGEGWTRTLEVRVPAGRMDEIRDRQRSRLGGTLDLEGFRKGKVPPRIVEKRFGDQLDELVVRSSLDDLVREALGETDLQPVDSPELSSLHYEKGEEMTFEAEVEVAPTVELARVGGFQIDRPSTEVTDEDVEEVLDRLRDDHAVYEPADRPPEEGDEVSVQIVPVDEAGEPEEEPGDPYRFTLGEGYAIPGVEQAITELSPGETGDFEVTFPEDFSSDELAGTTRMLRVTLHEVKARDLPALDDRLAAEIGDFDSLEELESAVVEDLRRHREEEAEETIRRSLLDAIVEANPFDVPEAMVDRYLDRVIDAPEEADPEQVQQARRRFRPRAEQEVKRQVVLDRLMERGGYEATDEELDARIREIAERRDEEPDRVRRQLRRQGNLEGVRRHLATEKLFDDLKEQSDLG